MALEDELDKAIERVLLSGGDLADRHGGCGASGEVGELLRLAVRLREAAPEADSGTRERVWKRVEAGIAQQPARSWVPRFVGTAGTPLLARVAAILLALLLASGTIVGVATANSLPDSSLYPLKLAVEQGSILLAPDPSSRAVMELSYAQRRLEEMLALDTAGKGVNSLALDALVQATSRAGEELDNVDDVKKREGVEADVAEVTSHQETVLSTLLEKAPEPAKQGLQRALEATQRVKDKAANPAQNQPAQNQPGKGRVTAPGQNKKSNDQGGKSDGQSEGSSTHDSTPASRGGHSRSGGSPETGH